MGEGKRFLLSLTIFSLVAGGVLGIDHYVGPIEEPEGYKILDYSATLYPNGTLEEVYTYLVKNDGEFHVLYRSWGSEVRFARGEGERVIPIDVNVTPSEGCIGYACSSLGQLETYHGKDLTIYSSDYVKRNEMGIYCREGLRKGTYVVRYTVKIYPELQKGSDGYLLHITFSEDGSAYERVAIRLTGFDVEDVWVPSYMEAAGEENLTIRTKERIDGPITAAILLKSVPEDFTRSGLAEVKSASREGRWSIRKVNLLYMFSLGTYTVVKYYYILFPVFFLALYLLLGREKYPGRVESERILPPPEKTAVDRELHIRRIRGQEDMLRGASGYTAGHEEEGVNTYRGGKDLRSVGLHNRPLREKGSGLSEETLREGRAGADQDKRRPHHRGGCGAEGRPSKTS